MRLDKFLKVSRLIKRRTVANEACDAGRVLVNGKTVNIPSYQVKAGDKIEIKEKKQSSPRYKAENGILAATAGRAVPEWLEADTEHMSGVVKEVPTRELIDVPVNEMLIVELYSK